MASTASFVEYVCEQASLAGEVTSRKMFGEYALYLHGKVVALVCDDEVFVKPTEGGRAVLTSVEEDPPYPGAKPYFRITSIIDDRQKMAELFTATANALPRPKPKRKRAPKK
jgi:TfoX/Sxy family transcriptional regulator of competence genes